MSSLSIRRIFAIACVLALHTGSGHSEDGDAAQLVVGPLPPRDDPPKAVLSPLSVLPVKGWRGSRILPAAGGRALVLKAPFGQPALVVRLDQPALLGTVPDRGGDWSLTANGHSVYSYDHATGQITRYPLAGLHPGKPFQLQVKPLRNVRLIGASGSGSQPVIVFTDQGPLFLDPVHLYPLSTRVVKHWDASPDIGFCPEIATLSADGRVFLSREAVGILARGTLDLYRVQESAWRPGHALSADGSLMVHNGRLVPITGTAPGSSDGPMPHVLPCLSSSLAISSTNGLEPEVRVLDPSGQRALMSFRLPKGASAVASFGTNRLAVLDHGRERLLVYAFNPTALAQTLGVNPWIDPSGARIVRSGQTVELQLLQAFGEAGPLALTGEVPGATLTGRTLRWRPPEVHSAADFRVAFVAGDPRRRDSAGYVDVIVLPVDEW